MISLIYISEKSVCHLNVEYPIFFRNPWMGKHREYQRTYTWFVDGGYLSGLGGEHKPIAMGTGIWGGFPMVSSSVFYGCFPIFTIISP